MFDDTTNPRAFVERDLLTLVAIRRSDRSLERLLETSPATAPQQLITELCAQLSSEYYAMRFFPAKD